MLDKPDKQILCVLEQTLEAEVDRISVENWIGYGIIVRGGGVTNGSLLIAADLVYLHLRSGYKVVESALPQFSDKESFIQVVNQHLSGKQTLPAKT